MKITELKKSKILKKYILIKEQQPTECEKNKFSRLEDRLIKVIQFEESREKRLRTTEQNLSDLQNIMKS